MMVDDFLVGWGGWFVSLVCFVDFLGLGGLFLALVGFGLVGFGR